MLVFTLCLCVYACVCVCVNEIKQLRKSEQLIDNFNNVLYKFMSIKTIGKANKKKRIYRDSFFLTIRLCMRLKTKEKFVYLIRSIFIYCRRH